MTRNKLLIGTGCLLSLVTFTTIALTQDDGPVRRRTDPNQLPAYDVESQTTAPPFTPNGNMTAYRQKAVMRTFYETVAVPVSAEEVKQLQAMHSAKEKLKKAQNDVARNEATEVIQKFLVKQFEQDLAQREKELAAAEERLKTLRQQFDKRKQAKDEIVSLRLKTIVNNAEGLGFPGDEDPRSTVEDDAPPYTPHGT